MRKEKMKEITVKTSWTFPIIRYNSQVYYFEVKKASGIAYILLELISNVEHNRDNLASTLYNFGVPFDIHYIFGDELSNMIINDIVRLKDGRVLNSAMLSDYVISDFEITSLGKKLFSEGTIPTGKEEIKSVKVFFDVVAKNQFANFKYKIYPVESTPLNQECYGEIFLEESDVELFVSENMKQYGFRNNESISKFVHEEAEKYVYKAENAVCISFDDDSMHITATDKIKAEYIKKYYSADVVSGIIMSKSKFSFPNRFADYIKKFEYNEVNNKSAVYIPSQIQNVLDIKNEMSLSLDSEMKKSNCCIEKDFANRLFTELNLDCYACYFNEGNLYKVYPGEYRINLDGWNEKCVIQLIVVNIASTDERDKVINSIYNEYVSSCSFEEKCCILKSIYRITGNTDYLNGFTISLLERYDTTEEKITELLSLHAHFKSFSVWEKIVVDNAKKLLDMLCSEIDINNINSKHQYGIKLKDVLNIFEIDYLSAIADSLKSRYDTTEVYEALCSLKYSTSDVLNTANVMQIWCKDILNMNPIVSNTDLGNTCSRIQKSLHDLKTITGIENPIDDEAYYEINSDEFIQSFSSYKKNFKKIEEYRVYNESDFEILKSYDERFTEISDMISIEKEANAKPEKINKKYINNLLSKSQYKLAICDLHVRLEYELNRLLKGSNDGTFEMLESKKIHKYLEDDEISEMQKLRICRNGFFHPKKRRDIEYSTSSILSWCDIIEKIGGYNK